MYVGARCAVTLFPARATDRCRWKRSSRPTAFDWAHGNERNRTGQWGTASLTGCEASPFGKLWYLAQSR